MDSNQTPPLTPAARQALKARAHRLDPVVMIGEAGLTAPVLAEIGRNLTAHELIKIRVAGDDREARAGIFDRICRELGASPVQQIGKILVVYRAAPREEPAAQPVPAPARRRRAAVKPGGTRRSRSHR